MKHIRLFALNVLLLFIIFIVSVIAFIYFITAEEYVTHSAGFEDVLLNPTKDAILFTVIFITSEIFYVMLSRFQVGAYLSRALISLLIIFLHVLIMFFGLVLSGDEFPLIVMSLVTEIAGVIVITMSSIDLVRNIKRAINSFE